MRCLLFVADHGRAHCHRSVILVSDNNFSSTQFTQFLAFDIGPSAIPEPASWVMMVLGFGLSGAAIRRSSRKPRFI